MRRPGLAATSAVAALAATAACSAGAGNPPADAVAATTLEHAERAVPLAAEALGATGVEAYEGWTSCMAISSKHEAFGWIVAPRGDAASRLEDVREALVGAGYSDVTQVEDAVTVERDRVTVHVRRPNAVHGPRRWQFSVGSRCGAYDGVELGEAEAPRPLEGLLP